MTRSSEKREVNVVAPKAPDVFNYTDYRTYMKDFFAYMKSVKPAFSYQYFAEKAGFKAKSFVHKVIKGERALSQTSVFNIARALNLKGRQINFFEALVHFNESSTAQEREYYYTRMLDAEPKSEHVSLKKNQYVYYSEWYHSVVRELVTIIPFADDYKKLARAVSPAISAREAQDSVGLLLGLGLIRKNDDTGLYEHTNGFITTRGTVVSLAVNKYQRDTMNLALKAHDVPERARRDFSTLTIGISAKGFENIRTELDQFRAHIGRIVSQDSPADRVYQLNLQLFPASVLPSEKKGAVQ